MNEINVPEFNIQFNVNELKFAAQFLEYMADHNLKCTPLIHDGNQSYIVTINRNELSNLVSYLESESGLFPIKVLARICKSNLIWCA